MTGGGVRERLRTPMSLHKDDVAVLLCHLKLRQLVDELDALDEPRRTFHERQEVRDRLRREIDVTQAAVMTFGPTEP